MQIPLIYPTSKYAKEWETHEKLLDEHGVLTHIFLDNLVNKIEILEPEALKRIDEYKKANSNFTTTTFQYSITSNVLADVKIYLSDRKAIHCTKCHESIENRIEYKLMPKKKTISIPNFMIHFFKNHCDLTIPNFYRINSIQIFKTNEIGKPLLLKDELLVQFMKHSNFNEAQLDQKKNDDATLEKLKCSPQQMGEVINELIQKADEIQSISRWKEKSIIVDERFEICWARFMGFQTCCLCDPFEEFGGYGKGTITNIQSGKSFKISTQMQHSIFDHGYFSEDLKNRIDPELAYEVLELSCK